jgi:hypothetical protein
MAVGFSISGSLVSPLIEEWKAHTWKILPTLARRTRSGPNSHRSHARTAAASLSGDSSRARSTIRSSPCLSDGTVTRGP